MGGASTFQGGMMVAIALVLATMSSQKIMIFSRRVIQQVQMQSNLGADQAIPKKTGTGSPKSLDQNTDIGPISQVRPPNSQLDTPEVVGGLKKKLPTKKNQLDPPEGGHWWVVRTADNLLQCKESQRTNKDSWVKKKLLPRPCDAVAKVHNNETYKATLTIKYPPFKRQSDKFSIVQPAVEYSMVVDAGAVQIIPTDDENGDIRREGDIKVMDGDVEVIAFINSVVVPKTYTIKYVLDSEPGDQGQR
eukprot:gnl/MRDRNA2_/MRDRNA2_102478_c0_seq1.p1 gnl/MRDRNA2_/MRDRNA2_102478_c0~~gnl/MRDRNA2_/MRDRNA2_102478_c0_seq1.p1  ORF type:complete len:247 (+),score=34.12 gnl/MRDRNA2_/MRDRNA2_102478_c0_seq1:120-860(+)